eukprot:COSAG01_NODE_42812_length_436_cov_0.916914_1_plen_35_part_10
MSGGELLCWANPPPAPYRYVLTPPYHNKHPWCGES